MLLLLETSAGYALFRVASEKKLKKIEDIYTYLQDPENASKIIDLQAFSKFKDTTEALKSSVKLISGKMSKKLKKFLQKNVVSQEVQEKLLVQDKKLAKNIAEELEIECSTQELDLFRAVRAQMNTLIEGLTEAELKQMTLGLSHGLSRYKVAFTADKVDTMIVQAISLLDDLDKELNNYMMRLREWFGWHFPEMSKIITDNLIYAKCVLKIGNREKVSQCEFDGILPEDVEKEVRQAAEISMGTEINSIDEQYIQNLAEQVVGLSEYRESLSEYLKNRMHAVAPNMTQVLGELVGARLISHAGSLVNLAKFPASTVQILGAEKALFKAMKNKKNTPKYGLIYQASLVGQASTKLKGKISRTLAAKTALCIRCDALGENEEAEIGVESKVYLEKRLRYLEHQSGNTNFETKKQYTTSGNNNNTQNKEYNDAADIQIQSKNDFQSQFKKSNHTLNDGNKRKASGNSEFEVKKQKKVKKE
ncbi:hypothetical protein PPERSA_01700 [Pseudocohnilembus persalinus]|uniref:Nop domain-containing protein n=1 Tax=Pseudocohnilembus persalinus TaxID=266149 RepID=A0A0V0R110_PSEPJ|nr:hypothetical protein PPERSA_01700 [Pseudocohnilembus persalinus]|eukprot:KRX08155.1 hypothetical protein PPERSA_01700 [Pseudocohnilembus persalinus]